MAQGLAYAHARGLVHRDIKPANLLFDEEGRVRVADFGVARALAEAAWTEPAGAMVGTARYISPEAAEGKPVDGRADVYSLALVLYEAVTGVVPFVTDTTMGTLAARIGQPLPHDDRAGPARRRAGPGRRARRGVPARRGRAGGPAGRAGHRAADAGSAAARHAQARGLRAHHRVPGPGRVRAHRLGDAVAAAAGAAAALTGDGTAIAPDWRLRTPVGTKAGPGELFDAEPASAGAPAEAQARGPSGTGAVGAVRPRTSQKWWWIGGGVAAGACSSPAGWWPPSRPSVHAVAPDAGGGDLPAGPGQVGGGQGPHDREGGRAGEVHHRAPPATWCRRARSRGCRRRRARPSPSCSRAGSPT